MAAGRMGSDDAIGSDPGMASGSKESSVSDTEADEMQEHLRGLGYLE